MSNELVTFGNFPTSKATVSQMADAVIDAVKGGSLNSLEVYIKLKAAGEFIDAVTKGIKSELGNEAEKYDLKKERPFGATVKATTTATRYDYTISADWSAAKAAENAAADKRKAIEKALQVADVNEYVDKLSGEIITTKPAVISGGERSYSVTLAE